MLIRIMVAMGAIFALSACQAGDDQPDSASLRMTADRAAKVEAEARGKAIFLASPLGREKQEAEDEFFKWTEIDNLSHSNREKCAQLARVKAAYHKSEESYQYAEIDRLIKENYCN